MDYTYLLELAKENAKHIARLNDDYTTISSDVAVLKSQMGDMIWWFRSIGGAILAMLIAQAWQLFKMHKK